jgi:hypothetical protein
MSIDRVKVKFINLMTATEKDGRPDYYVQSDIRNGLFAAVAGVVQGPGDPVWISEKGPEISKLIQEARVAPPIRGENAFIYLLTMLFEGLWEKKAWEKAIEWADEHPELVSMAIRVDIRLQAQEAEDPDPEEIEGVETVYEEQEEEERLALAGPREGDIVAPAPEVEEGDMVDEPAKKGGRRRRTVRSKKESRKAKKSTKKSTKKSKKASRRTRRR